MSIEHYIQDLSHADIFVRMQAAKALKLLGDPRAVEPLIGALEDQNPGVRALAAVSLAALTGVDMGEDPAAWRRWRTENPH